MSGCRRECIQSRVTMNCFYHVIHGIMFKPSAEFDQNSPVKLIDRNTVEPNLVP